MPNRLESVSLPRRLLSIVISFVPILALMTVLTVFFLGDRSPATPLRMTDLRGSGSWEVHTGDLPLPPARAGTDSGTGWERFHVDSEQDHPPIPRDYEGIYWFRLPLPDLQGYQDPQLFVRGYKSLQLYAGDRLLYEFNMGDPDPRVNKFLHWGLAPLEQVPTGEMLYVRILQTDKDPIMGSFTIGSRGDIYLNMFKRDMLRIIICVVFLFLSVMAFSFHAGQRDKERYLYFGVITAASAYAAIGRSQVLQLISDFPLFIYLQDAGLPFGAAALFLFFGTLYQGFIRRFCRWMALLCGAFTPVCIAAALKDPNTYHFIIDNIFINFALLGLVAVIIMFVASFSKRKDRETLWVLSGILMLCVFAWLHHMQMSLMPYDFMMSTYLPRLMTYLNETMLAIGLLLFVLSLGGIFILRLSATQRKLAEYAQELESKNIELLKHDKLKDDFLARTSHELRTPLYGMIGLAEAVQEDCAPMADEGMKRRLSLLISSGQRLSRLINDILDLSKIKHHDLHLNLRRTDVRQAVDVVLVLLQTQAARKGLRLANEVPPDLAPALADEDRLEQVLVNLIGNAIKFTTEGGIRLFAERRDGLLHVSVADTGVGIAPEEQGGIFDVFVQGSRTSQLGSTGTGLGLAVSRQLIELQGGSLTVRSEPGGGSTFTFTLPVWSEDSLQEAETVPALRTEEPGAGAGYAAERLYAAGVESPPAVGDKPEAAASGVSDASDGGGPFTVLVVDDEPVNLELLSGQLAPEYRVVPVGSAEAALVWIEGGGRPDLILTDLMMPRMNGFELLTRIRDTYRDVEIPILLLTARGLQEDASIGFDLGASDYIAKPVNKKELLARIRLHIRLSKMNTSLEQEVRLRTQELEEANRELQLSIRETMRALKEVVALEERTRVAHEIHDVVGHTLTATIIQLETTKHYLDRDPATAKERLETAQNLVRKGLEDIRGLVRMLRDDIENRTLQESVLRLVSETESVTGIAVTCDIADPLPEVDSAVKKTVYHALQEGLTNGLKHGGGTRFHLTLEARDGELHFALRNNGAPYPASPYGFGLKAMRERVRSLNGRMEVGSAPDWGCELVLALPLPEQRSTGLGA